MPYLKFSRDKRGYESFYLFEPAAGRQNQGRPRLLFWFRTAPHIKVGREPFSEETRRAIEARNPDIVFDWPRLMATPIPPPDLSQHWRERRRAEKTARRAAIDDVPDPADTEIAAGDTSGSSAADQPAPGRDAGLDVELDAAAVGDEDGQPEQDASIETAAGPAETAGRASEADKTAPPQRRRRRRRRGRKPETAVSSPPVEPPLPVDEV